MGSSEAGFLRGFAGPPMRCFPMGSSEAAFCGVFQRRRCAQRRRSLLSFSPPPPGERMPRARSRPCEPAGSPYPFPHFPARPSHASSFTLPPGQRYRARSPRRCSPKGSSEAAFCGIFQRRRCAQRRRSLLSFSPPPPGRTSFFTIRPDNDAARAHSRSRKPAGSPYPFPHFPFSPRARVVLLPLPCRPANDTAHGRRNNACRRARLKRPSTGFCRAAAAMLPVGLVRGGFLRGFAGPPRRCLPMGSSEAAFCGVLQGRRGDACRWARPRRLSAGFSNAAEAVLPEGLVRGGFPRDFPTAALRAAPPFPFVLLSPAARGTDAARPFPPMRTGGQSLPFSTFSYRPAVLLSLPSRPANDAARHFSCIHLSRRTAGTAPLSLPPARAAEQRAPFSPYRRRARRCISFFYTQPTGQRMPRAVAPFPQTGKRTLSLSHTFGQRARPFPFTRTGGLPLPFSTFSGQQACASGRRPRTAHSPCSCARLLPPHLSFDFRPALPSAQPTPVRASLPRRFLRFRAALFPAAARCIRPCSCAGGRIAPFFRLSPRAPGLCARRARPVRPACAHRVEAGKAVKPAAARSCTPGPVPARADASRRSFAFPLARRAPFLPCAPCTPGLCASRRGGGSCKAICCALLHARPALKQRARNRRPASASPRARPVRPPRTPGTSVPPRTPGASVPLLAAVRFGSHSAVQSLPIFFHRPAGKRTQKANLIRTYVRIRF